MVTASAGPRATRMGLVLAASAAGTVFEWYDFFIFGSLLSIITKHFFAGAGETQGYILALLTFAVGFAVRPFGGLVFGYFGDRTGRKRAFLVTITMMGVATFAIGLCLTRPCLEMRRLICWSGCAFCKASRSAVSMAGPRSMSPNTPHPTNAARRPAGFR